MDEMQGRDRLIVNLKTVVSLAIQQTAKRTAVGSTDCSMLS